MGANSNLQIIVVGTGITGLVTAYTLLKNTSDAKVTVITNLKKEECQIKEQIGYNVVAIPSLAGPLGVETQSGQIWNGPDIKERVQNSNQLQSNLYINKKLGEYSRRWLERFSNIDNSKGSFLDRSKKLYTINYFSTNKLKSLLDGDFDKIALSFNGNLRLFTSETKMNIAYGYQEVIDEIGGEQLKRYNKKKCISQMPKLSSYINKNKIIGGVFYPEDGKLDGAKFYKYIMNKLINNKNVQFIYNQQIVSVDFIENQLVSSNGEKHKFDKCILSTGLGTIKIFKDFDYLHPLWGWSCKLPYKNKNKKIKNTVGFNKECFIFSDYGDYIRVGGTTEIMDISHINPSSGRVEKLMLKNIKSIFGNAVDVSQAECFAGARAMTIDDLPIIQEYSNDILMLIPTGHLGILQSAGLADIANTFIKGVQRKINISDYSINRFKKL